MPPCLDGVPDYFCSRLLAVHGASPRVQYCSISFYSGRKCVPVIKAMPTFHNSSLRKTTILVALALVIGARD